MIPFLRMFAPIALLFVPVSASADPLARNWDRVTAEDVVFDSAGAQLAGSLYSPVGAPRAALVLVHSANQHRRMDDFARLFAAEGFAVLTYDRRGAGRSEGALPDGPEFAQPVLDALASDVAAAMRHITSLPGLSDLPAGFWGMGEAGWVAPQAGADTPQTDFLVLWSGAAMTVSEMLEDRMAHGDHPQHEADMRAMLEAIEAGGPDPSPAPALARFGRPSLWIYGGEDRSMPVPLAVHALETVVRAGHPEVTIAMNQEGGHRLDLHHDREMFDSMIGWMLSQRDSGRR